MNPINLSRVSVAMTRTRLFACCVVAVALGCKKDATFTEPVPRYASITWLNAISDTMQLDVRVVDIATNASFTDADFAAHSRSRSTWNPAPSHQGLPEQHGGFDRETVPARYDLHVCRRPAYFFYLSGRARAGGARATITRWHPPPRLPGNSRFASEPGALVGRVDPRDTRHVGRSRHLYHARNARPAGAPTIAGLAYGTTSPYVFVDTGSYRIELVAPGSTDPAIVQVMVPPVRCQRRDAGIAGSRVAGSVLTAVIVPRSDPPVRRRRPGHLPAYDTSVAEAARRISLSGDTVTVQVGSITILTNRHSSTAQPVPTRPSPARERAGARRHRRGVVLVSGATQLEYNGWQEVLSVVDTLICRPSTRATSSAATIAAVRRPRIPRRECGHCAHTVPVPLSHCRGTASPGTGTTVYRIYPPCTPRQTSRRRRSISWWTSDVATAGDHACTPPPLVASGGVLCSRVSAATSASRQTKSRS